jgi:hypothetical protein
VGHLPGLRSDLIDPAIAAHHGRIVKRTADGICSHGARELRHWDRQREDRISASTDCRREHVRLRLDHLVHLGIGGAWVEEPPPREPPVKRRSRRTCPRPRLGATPNSDQC